MARPRPKQAAIVALGTAAWLAAAHVLAGDVAAFAASPRGFLLLVGAVAEGTIEAAGLRVTPEFLTDVDPGAPLIVLGFAGAAYALHTWTPGATPTQWAVTAVGVLLFLAGAGLRAWSQQTLGHRFTAHVAPDTEGGLVTAGPYRHVRHPSYLALLLVFPSAPLVLSSLPGAAIALAGYLPFLVLRTRHEEARLREAFGDEYEAYAERTPALIPRPW